MIWNAKPEFWNKHSPVLFPIVGSLKNNTYHYKDEVYKMSRHGFARDFNFTLIDQQTDTCTFSLKQSSDTLLLYPFKFELQIKYSLQDKQLLVEYKVSNPNDFTMPFSLGAHPAFALSEPFENYSIEMEADDSLVHHLLDEGLLTETTESINLPNNMLPLSYSLFEKDALVIKNLKSTWLTILKNEKPFVKVEFNEFPHLGIWTKANAPFICIEPWQGYSDSSESTGDLFKKEGIVCLESGAEWNASFGIEVY